MPIATFDEYLGAARFILKGDPNAAFAAYQRLRTLAAPPWLRLSCVIDLASLYLAQGQTTQALDALEEGISLGYSDCVGLHLDPNTRALFQDARFCALYKTMRVSEADLQELIWLHSEIRVASNETPAIVSENLNRADQDFTEVPQSALPQREPQTLSVHSVRAWLLVVQALQREIIFHSDQSRMMHRLNAQIIQGMPTGGPGFLGVDQAMAAQESRMAAMQRAMMRREAVHRRAFVPDLSLSTEPAPCPLLGSLG